MVGWTGWLRVACRYASKGAARLSTYHDGICTPQSTLATQLYVICQVSALLFDISALSHFEVLCITIVIFIQFIVDECFCFAFLNAFHNDFT